VRWHASATRGGRWTLRTCAHWVPTREVARPVPSVI